MTSEFSIKHIRGREILSSGGRPTVEATVQLEGGLIAKASVPFGVSDGTHEAITLIDEDPKRFKGFGCLKAVNNINNIIAPELMGMDVRSQSELDAVMLRLDGTKNKSKLGGNATLAVSLACARAAAKAQHLPLFRHVRNLMKWPKDAPYKLPNPLMVVIEGGAHADNSTDLQEYLIAPVGAPSVRENIRIGIEVYHTLKDILKKEGYNTNVGNEGAYAPAGIRHNEQPLRLINQAIIQAGYEVERDVRIGIDAAASEFYKNDAYHLKVENKKLKAKELAQYYQQWHEQHELFLIEDGLAEDDWDNWQHLNQMLGDKMYVVGDDLTVTNAQRLERAVQEKSINSMIIKPNQIGTLTETIVTINYAKKHNIETIVSHRGGGETTDDCMMDIAAAANSIFTKVGPSRGERTVKYNRIMEIEEELSGEEHS